MFLLLRAHKATDYGFGAATDDEFIAGVMLEKITFYIAERDDKPELCARVQWGTRAAMYVCLYSEGPESHLIANTRACMALAVEDMKARGITEVAALVEGTNPDAERIIAFHRRVTGLVPSAILLSGPVR